jgi:APA family basic amino acid/polyamine antiporter
VNIFLAVTTSSRSSLLVVVGLVLVFSPSTLDRQRPPRRRAELEGLLIAIPVAMIAYTGIETISNMAEEAKDETKTIPRRSTRVVIAVFAIYALLPMVALSALPVEQNADGTYQTLLGAAESQGGYAGDPVLGSSSSSTSASCRRRRGLRRPAGGDDPLHRHQRRDHRRLAARLLDGPAPPAARPPAPAAPALRHAVDRHPRVRRDRLPGDDPGQASSWATCTRSARCSRSRSRTLGDPPAPSATRRARPTAAREHPPRGTRPAALRRLGGLGTGLAFLVVTFLHIDVAIAGLGWLLSAARLPDLPRRHGLDLTTTVKVAIPAPVVDHEAEYDSVLVALEGRDYAEGRWPRDPRGARTRRGIHVLVTITGARPPCRSRPSCPSRSSPPRRSSSRPSSRAAAA